MRQADRAASPHKYVIALYWEELEPEFVPHIGEPACFACGWRSDRWPELTDDSEAALRKAWEATRGLTVCHLVPHSLGGPGEAGNLVLLCKDCHSAAPDFLVPDYMLKWMRNRTSWVEDEMARVMAALSEAADAFGRPWPPAEQDAEELSAIICDPGFCQFYKEAVAVVPGKSLSHRVGTIMAALCEYSEIRLDPGELFGVSEGGAYRYAA